MPRTIPTEDEIRLRAYHLWDINGRQDGRELDYWLQAALELEDLASAGHHARGAASGNAVANRDHTAPGGMLRWA